MTTKDAPQIIVQPNGLVIVCAYCVARAELARIQQQYPAQVSHSICEACVEALVPGLGR